MCGAKCQILDVRTPERDRAVAAAVAALTAGRLVVLPTDTVYGIACRADADEAVQRLFAAKGRPESKALPILVAEVRGLERLCGPLTQAAVALAERFWPGPLTLVLPKTGAVSDLVTGGQPTVGVRVPDCDSTRAVLARCPFPVAVTSANLSGEPAVANLSDIPPALLAHVAVALDAGLCPGAVPSTVLDLSVSPPRLLRSGLLTVADLAPYTGPLAAEP